MALPETGAHFANLQFLRRPMGQKKLERFAQIKDFPNVFEYAEARAGHWHEHFGNANPITLELACGKGEYALGLGRLHPQSNFVGVDVKGNRIWVGARTALREGLSNVAFLRSQMQRVNEFFAADEVAEIWITFPDPQLRHSKRKRRLTHPRYLRLYQQFLQPGGRIHLKTDSPVLYAFTQQVIELYQLPVHAQSDDVYNSPLVNDALRIKTHYEGLDIAGSNRIHYLCFGLPHTLPLTLDNQLKQMFVPGESFEDERRD